MGGELNILGFGADATGEILSTSAIQTALDVAKEFPNTTIRFPAGTYLYDDTLQVRDTSGLTIRAAGATLKVADGTAINKGGLRFVHCANQRIEGLTLDGNTPNRDLTGANMDAGTNNLTFMNGCENITLLDVTSINSAKDGLQVGSDDAPDIAPRTTCADLHVERMTISGHIRNGIALTHLAGGVILDSLFERAGYPIEGSTTPSIDAEGYVNLEVTDILIERCTFQNAYTRGGQVSIGGNASTNVRVLDCDFDNVSRAATIANSGNMFSNNRVVNVGYNGGAFGIVYVDGGVHTVSSNSIDATGDPDSTIGIQLASRSSACVVISNTVTGTEYDGIKVAGNGHTLGGNTVIDILGLNRYHLYVGADASNVELYNNVAQSRYGEDGAYGIVAEPGTVTGHGGNNCIGARNYGGKQVSIG